MQNTPRVVMTEQPIVAAYNKNSDKPRL